MQAVDDFDDGDSAFDGVTIVLLHVELELMQSMQEESEISSTTSIGSSILKYRQENGRTYHAYKDGSEFCSSITPSTILLTNFCYRISATE